MTTQIYTDDGVLGAAWDAIASAADMANDMADIMANLNALETFIGYPLTEWADPTLISLRCTITGDDIPEPGLYITDAINRIRVQVFSIPAISDWGFDPSVTSDHVTMRDNLQRYLGGPASCDFYRHISYKVHGDSNEDDLFDCSIDTSPDRLLDTHYLVGGNYYTASMDLVAIDAVPDADADAAFAVERDLQTLLWDLTILNPDPFPGPLHILRLGFYDGIIPSTGDCTDVAAIRTGMGAVSPLAPTYDGPLIQDVTIRVLGWLDENGESTTPLSFCIYHLILGHDAAPDGDKHYTDASAVSLGADYVPTIWGIDLEDTP